MSSGCAKNWWEGRTACPDHTHTLDHIKGQGGINPSLRLPLAETESPHGGKCSKERVGPTALKVLGPPRVGETPSATEPLFGHLDVYPRFRHAPNHEIATPNRPQHDLGLCGPRLSGKRFLITSLY